MVALVRDRDFALLWWGGLVSHIGNGLTTVAVGWLLVHKRDSPRYGLGRSARRELRAAAGAAEGDCAVIYAHPEHRARKIDDSLHPRLSVMT